MPAIFNNPLLLITCLLLGLIPAVYMNKYLLKLTRPRESAWRFLAYCIIFLAFTVVYTTLVVFVLKWTVFKVEAE
ncbi:hypothetical protein [Paraflavitalea pollutisoli]|uniref:hypothetical protein n=1 Tax=Paraflavitalea pollutisoli TaxID=3034143 RepID=UPI0023EB18C9|nr:hypothetical protein [Paraflavitalea sp. H1-2-19X]